MDCIINGIDFFDLEAMKYYSTPSTWSAEKKKENATNKIFSGLWWGSMKKDGIFVMVGRNPEGEIFLRPRSRNVKKEFVNKVDWVPHLHSYLSNLELGTVLLGELYLPRDEQAKSSSSIMNSLQAKAIKKQEKEEDKLILYIFDILADGGESYLDMKAIDRFLRVEDYSKKYMHPYIEYAVYYNGKMLWDNLQTYLAEGREGMVITYEDAKYEPGKRSSKISLKIKKEIQETVDCVIIGANSPSRAYTGKEIEEWPYWFDNYTNEKVLASDYLNTHHTTIYGDYADGKPLEPVTKNWFYGWAGSLKLGLYDGDKLVHVGDLSGVTDEVKENWKDYVGEVVEIGAMEISENAQGGWGFRHPKLLSWRKDKPARECTIDQVK